jgi:hypothetical protein
MNVSLDLNSSTRGIPKPRSPASACDLDCKEELFNFAEETRRSDLRGISEAKSVQLPPAAATVRTRSRCGSTAATIKESGRCIRNQRIARERSSILLRRRTEPQENRPKKVGNWRHRSSFYRCVFHSCFVLLCSVGEVKAGVRSHGRLNTPGCVSNLYPLRNGSRHALFG